jgi:hypothetical protein
LRRAPQVFTINKGTVRNLQKETIEKYLSAKIPKLRYFGLPSSALGDAKEWSNLFHSFVAVERGEKGKEWELQHDLELEAFRSGLFDKITLLRGGIDSIIRKGRDDFGTRLRFPFDVVSLDYSGGLFYRNRKGELERLKAISSLIEQQGKKESGFVLLISCNLDQLDRGEIQGTLGNMKTELVRYGLAGERVIDAYLSHERDEVRLKLYVQYFVNQEAAKNHFNCETQKAIYYDGNRGVRMMAFRFWLAFDPRTEALRSPRERLSQIINRPLTQICDGICSDTLLGLPTIQAPDSERSADSEKPCLVRASSDRPPFRHRQSAGKPETKDSSLD